MINFPDINPVILSVGPLAITWYSMAYVAGILLGWFYANKLIDVTPNGIGKKNLEDFISWAIIFIIIGGRLGYVIFYDPQKYLEDPIQILRTYEGGMSFHGGIFGVGLAAWLYCRRNQLQFLALADIISTVAPIGLFLGRLANFINGELCGRVTDVPWGMIFPYSDNMPRHPSQLYEAGLEGFVLFFIMAYFVFRHGSLRASGRMSGIFLIFYGIFRITVEFFRQPDAGIGFIGNGFTLGQLLCIPMIFLGSYLVIYSSRNFIKSGDRLQDKANN